MSTSPLSANKFRLAFVLFWITWGAVHVIVMHGFGFHWQIAWQDAAVTVLLLAATCLLVSNNFRYYLPQQHRYWYLLLWSLGLSVAWLVLSRWALLYIHSGDEHYAAFLSNSLLIRGGIALLVIGCMAMLSVLWYTLQEQKENEQRKADAIRLSREAELFNLRQQLQPHFLFNSLNSINALISTRPEEARKMIQQLADFLRGTLKKDEQQWVVLAEEVKHLQLYLAIEKVRFGHRLVSEILCDEDTEQMMLPALLLQPVVENAIKFGLYDTTSTVVIRLHARKEGSQLVISVENPFDPSTAPAVTGTGFGLKSVERRLYLLFARNDLLTTSVEGHRYTTIIKIPQQHD